jgi:hypothetical protein
LTENCSITAGQPTPMARFATIIRPTASAGDTQILQQDRAEEHGGDEQGDDQQQDFAGRIALMSV